MSSEVIVTWKYRSCMKSGWVGMLGLIAAMSCGPAEDFQEGDEPSEFEEIGESSEGLKLTTSQTVVFVSSVEPSTPHVGSRAVDGNATTTRWSSAFSDPQWITLDLGSSKA